MATCPLINKYLVTCTAVNKEAKENELAMMTKKLGSNFIRNKETTDFKDLTTHLVVGELTITKKFLAALAAGIPIVDTKYIEDSYKKGNWCDAAQYDVGNPDHHLRRSNGQFIPPLQSRRRLKESGGMFQGWRAVVVLKDMKIQEAYRTILELGGAKVERWTVRHLSDLTSDQVVQLTHVVSQPELLLNKDFQNYLRIKGANTVPTVHPGYVEDWLLGMEPQSLNPYDIRREAPKTPTQKEKVINSPRFSPLTPPRSVSSPALQSTPDSTKPSRPHHIPNMTPAPVLQPHSLGREPPDTSSSSVSGLSRKREDTGLQRGRKRAIRDEADQEAIDIMPSPDTSTGHGVSGGRGFSRRRPSSPHVIIDIASSPELDTEEVWLD